MTCRKTGWDRRLSKRTTQKDGRRRHTKFRKPAGLCSLAGGKGEREKKTSSVQSMNRHRQIGFWAFFERGGDGTKTDGWVRVEGDELSSEDRKWARAVFLGSARALGALGEVRLSQAGRKCVF